VATVAAGFLPFEARAETGVILRGVVDHFLTSGQDVVFDFLMRTATGHAFSQHSLRPPRGLKCE
jgi:hypothetical protein